MAFVCHEEQFPGGVPEIDPREANDKCIIAAKPSGFAAD